MGTSQIFELKLSQAFVAKKQAGASQAGFASNRFRQNNSERDKFF